MFLFILLAVAVVVILLWQAIRSGKKRFRSEEIMRLFEKAENGDPRAKLKMYRERAFLEDEAREFGYSNWWHELMTPIVEAILCRPHKVNGWVAEKIEHPAFADFENLALYRQLRKGALRRRFVAALRTHDRTELLICTAYYEEWPSDVRQDVGDVLWAKVAEMIDAQDAEKEMATT